MTPYTFRILLLAATLFYIAKVLLLDPARFAGIAGAVSRFLVAFQHRHNAYLAPAHEPRRLSVTEENFLRLAGAIVAATALFCVAFAAQR